MPAIPKPKVLLWTNHARAKMHFYKLSEGRVRRVLQSPKRVEEGVAPDTVAMMQPTSPKLDFSRRKVVPVEAGIRFSQNSQRGSAKETWSQEIWVMVQDGNLGRKIISAWRYPGMSKVRSLATLQIARQEYEEFIKET
jgi:hypothetical protein